MILEGLDAKVVDNDNAFLNRDLDHEIFMKIPEGYKECIQDYDELKALKLDKAIYGLVQAAYTFLLLEGVDVLVASYLTHALMRRL